MVIKTILKEDLKLLRYYCRPDVGLEVGRPGPDVGRPTSRCMPDVGQV